MWIRKAKNEKSDGLDLSKNRISHLPPEIGELEHLKVLDISGTGLEELPPEIGKLSSLRVLKALNNKLTSLPKEIGQLKSLMKLDLHNNSLTLIPIEIGQLAQLTGLSLGYNQLSSLPPEIRKLDKLAVLYLDGNPLPIPPEILLRYDEPRAIIDYYFSRGKKPLNEIKLLVVGQGSVGKTSLIEQILHGTFDEHQRKTEGIAIKAWAIDDGRQTTGVKPSSVVHGPSSNNPSSIKLNIWDFGGQEIMHATHQFFLTRRSLYLLVLDARLTQEENRVEYWLKIIQSFGGDSPVLVVGNKIDQHPLDLDRTGLQKKYPNVVAILETSAATGAGIDALKAEITRQIETLPHVRDKLPEAWFSVKSKLEKLGRQKNFITHDEYLALCAANDVTDATGQRTLVGFLHDLGVVLHFQDDPRLEALGILNPQWVTNGVYKLLNARELFDAQGRLGLSLLNRVLDLPEYPAHKRLFIVDMMKKFELCYDIEPDKSFLVPDLLPKDEPDTGDWAEALAFEYHYNVLPTSIITRFIVRMNVFVGETVWRSGTALENGGSTALVRADTEDRKVYIQVAGEEHKRRDFLAKIRGEFDAIHATISKIEVREMVPVPGHPEAEPVDFGLLLQMERDRIEVYPVLSNGKMVLTNPHEMLNGVESESTRQQRERGGNVTHIHIGGDVGGNVVVGDHDDVTS